MSQIHSAPFAIVPEWLLDAPISDRAVRLFAMLARYADGSNRAFPGRRRLAERLDCAPSTCDAAFNELIAVGALSQRPRFRSDGGRTTNDYWLWPAEPPVTAEDPPTDSPVAPPRPIGEPPPDPSGGQEEREPVEREPVNDKEPPLPPHEPENGSTPNRLELVAVPATDEVRQVFDAWVAGKGTRAVLSKERQRLIAARLKEFPVEDLVDAVRGWRQVPFNRGENPSRTVYNDLGLLLRDADHVERFRDLQRGEGAVSSPSVATPNHAHYRTALTLQARRQNRENRKELGA